MKGRKKVPDAIRRLQGTDKPYLMSGDRPIFKLQEVSSMPTAPEYMNDVATQIYYDVTKQMIELGLVNNANFAMIVTYAQCIGKYHDAEIELKKQGMVVTDAFGNSKTNPYNKISNDAMALALRIGSEFGLTPSAQSRIMNLVKKPEVNSFNDI
jgi:P27 family predicted phage terminase small subunit